MKAKITALLLAVITLLSFSSCVSDEKPVDLSSFDVGKSEIIDVSGSMFAYFLYYAKSQDYYSSYYGYDAGKSLREQPEKCGYDESMTWFEFYASMAKNSVNQYVALASAAMASGMELSEDELKDLDDYFTEYEEDAYYYGYKTVEEKIADDLVEGISLEDLKEIFKIQLLAGKYTEAYFDILEGKEYSDEIIAKYAADHPEEFLAIDMINYTFYADCNSSSTDEEKAQAYAETRKRAENFLNTYKDEESFKKAIVDIENSYLSTPSSAENILLDYVITNKIYDMDKNPSDSDKAYYEWAYSSDRNEGDTYLREVTLATGEKYYTVYYITKPAYIVQYSTKNVRHILFMVDGELDGDEYLAARDTAKQNAENIFNEYINGEMTEERFAELAKEHSEDGNAEVGGIYENVPKDYMVTEFEDWIYDDKRQIGDTEIIQTSFGYHIMYFVGDGCPSWELEATEGYISQLFEEHLEEMIDKYSVKYDNKNINKIP